MASSYSSLAIPFYLHPDFSAKQYISNHKTPALTIPNRQRLDSMSDFSSYSSSTSLSSSLSGYSLNHTNLSNTNDTDSLYFESNNSSSCSTDAYLQSETNTGHSKIQQDFIAQVCAQVESRIKQLTIRTELSQLFWVYLCDKLNLNALLATLGGSDEIQNLKMKLEFFQNLNKLMQCLHLIENELEHLAINSIDDQLVIEATFLVYEEANNQMSDSLLMFEEKVSHLLKYVPVLLNSPVMNKKLFNELVKSNESDDCFICSRFVDVGEILLKPNINEEKLNQPEANPITQSYSCLIQNLNALSMITHDPISEAYELAQETGCEADIVSVACLNISYYTMGLFELKKSLFENKFQFLYELNQFYDDFNYMFSNDNFCSQNGASTLGMNEFGIDQINLRAAYFDQSWDTLVKGKSNEQNESLKECPSPKWKFEKLINQSSQQEPEKIESIPILDDILKRLNTLNTPEVYNNYLKLIKEKLAQSSNAQTNLNWSKTSRHTICTNFSLAKSQTDHIFDTGNSKTAWQASKSDLKPIGAKPASMFTISNSSNRYHVTSTNNNKSISVPTSKKPQKKIHSSLIKNIFTPSIWTNNDSKAFKKSSYSFISPFITYNDNDEFKKSISKLKNNVQLAADTPAFKPRHISNLTLLNDQSLRQPKQHGRSVAPLAMQQQQQQAKYQKPAYQSHKPYFSTKPSKTVYSSDIYTCLEESSLFHQKNIKNIYN